MMKKRDYRLRSVWIVFALAGALNALAIEDGNPLVSHIYTADPSAHVFEDRVYIYGSHDKDNSSGFNMEDYHVLSSSNLVDWVDHGMVLHVSNVVWAASKMWAPDCAYKDGMYYFYFPAVGTDGDKHIGVATSTSPAGPFDPEESYIEGTDEIDPAVFIDDDGLVYLYWGGYTLKVAKLDETMKQIDGDVTEVEVDYYYEGPWMHKKDGIYYLSYSDGGRIGAGGHVIAYATSTSPLGPFTYQGILNDDVPGITNHGSTLKHKGQWYYFYHNTNLSGINTRRCIVADYMHHSDDGSIRTVIQTDLGIGRYDGLAVIEAENYTETENVEKRENPDDDGLHTVFDPGDELLFTYVDMDVEVSTNVILRIASGSSTGSLDIRADGDQLLGSIAIPDTGGTDVWMTMTNPIVPFSGRQDITLAFVNTETNQLCLDWFDFWGQAVDDRENIALSGSASQSSTNYGGEASRAIDGDISGAWDDGSVTHTASEGQPWWEVDLGVPFSVDEIVVWGRTDDSTKGRLSDYDVTLLDRAGNAVWSDYQASYPDPSVSLDPSGITGQVVRVQLRGTNALSLAEVQVYGACGIPVGLVARWPMDDGSGSVVSDAGGYGFDAARTGAVWTAGFAGGALEFNGSVSDDSVIIPAAVFAGISNGISVAFWAYGDPELQPWNCTVFGAVNEDGSRVFNIHLPWSSRVYWDAGDGDGFDRISKTMTAAEYAGRWNHWVFTKDASAGTMGIYLNGALWLSGTGKSKTLNGEVAEARFGSRVNADYYAGSLDDFRIYNYALDAGEITALYGSSVYSGWASGCGLSGDDALSGADADNDGYDNLAEYALGMNPINSDAGLRDWNNVLSTGGSNWFDYVHYRRTNYAGEGLNYLLIDSTNLLHAVSSTNAQDQIFVGPAVDGYEPVTNRYEADESVRFIQLKIEQD